MDSGISFKAPISAVATEPVRPVVSAPAAVPTELPPAKVVNPAANTLAIRNDPALTQSATTHDVIIDPASREVIYRVLDANSRQVLRQVPDQALLRMRAYTRALEKGESAPDALALQDLQA